jgi:ribosomal protein S28E/S33
MLVYVIDLSLHFNAHLVPWEDWYENAPSDPDCVSVDAATFRQAIEAFWASTGCKATLTSTRKRRCLGLLGSYDAVTDLEATIIRGRRRVVVRNVDEPLQAGDVIALDGRFC